MNRKKQYIMTMFIGFLFLISGFIGKSFITIKPNRIVEGTVIDLYTVIKDNFVLFTVFFLLIVGLLLLVIKYNKLWYLLVANALSFILILFYLIGDYANMAMLEYGSPARISLNMGFWLAIIGLFIIIDSGYRLDTNYNQKRSLLVFISLIIGMVLLIRMGYMDHIGLMKEYIIRQVPFIDALKTHMILTFVAAIVGLFFSVLMSYIAYKHKKYKKYLLLFTNGAQVIPTLSFLGLLMIPLTLLAKQFQFLKDLGISGIGFFPAFIVLTSYTLLPIVNQSIAGFESIDTQVIESAKAMGMTKLQLFERVELPLALPSILSGFKIALIQTTANAILAGLVGGGGLGALLFLGLAQSAPDLVTLSALSIVMIALILNALLSMMIGYIETRRGLV